MRRSMKLLILVAVVINAASQGIDHSSSALPIPSVSSGLPANQDVALQSAFSPPVSSQAPQQQSIGSVPVAGSVMASNMLPQLQQPMRSQASPVRSQAALHAHSPVAGSMGSTSRGMFRGSNLTPPKPNIEAVKPHLLTFIPYDRSAEDCKVVSDDIQQAGLIQQHITVFAAISMLDHRELEAQETIRINADLLKYFTSLDSQMFDRDDHEGGTDLHSFFRRLSRCKIETDTGRGMLQKIMYLGLNSALTTPFGRLLLIGESGDEPSFELDANGNTILHLAAMSGSSTMASTLIREEIRKNRGDPSKMSNGMFWVLSALEHKNSEGKTPKEVTTDPNVQSFLQSQYRMYAGVIKRQAAQHRKRLQG